MSVLVVAWGNPFRQDDGFGPCVAEALEPRLRGTGVEVHTCMQLTPELAPMVSGADRVVFVDASELLPPGCLDVARVGHVSDGPVSHHVEPGLLMGLSHVLYGASPEAWLVSLGGRSFDVGEGLSPAVQAGVAGAVECVLDLVAAPIAPARPPCRRP